VPLFTLAITLKEIKMEMNLPSQSVVPSAERKVKRVRKAKRAHKVVAKKVRKVAKKRVVNAEVALDRRIRQARAGMSRAKRALRAVLRAKIKAIAKIEASLA
jgi:hypothetical protein